MGAVQVGLAIDDLYDQAMEEPLACYRSMTAYSNGIASDITDVEDHCWLGRSKHTIWKKRTYDELNFWRNNALSLNDVEKARCNAADNNDWHTVSDGIRQSIAGHRKIKSILPGTFENIPDQMSALEAKAFFRSVMEQEMTRLLADRAQSGQQPFAPCQSFQKAHTLARLDNVLFFDGHAIFEKRGPDQWLPEINLRLWLVAQHADFFPSFQVQGLEYFQSIPDGSMSLDRHISMLKKRITDNSKAEWYLKFKDQEGSGN
jgi:hypothetical protein